MLSDFNEHINAKFPYLRDKRLLVAVSAGVDSLVLTHLLVRSNFKIELAHCNFLLRGEDANDDELFVSELAKELSLKIHTKQFDTKRFAENEKLSIQMAARKLRYDWFNELLQEHELDFVITAHHLDDCLETFLINLTRATGLEGLTGIPAKNDKVMRPFLPFSKTDILTYAQTNHLNWREDSSNNDTKYIRNKLRKEVIPGLKEINPGLLNAFKQTQSYLEQSQLIIDERMQELKKNLISTGQDDVIKINISKIKKLSHPKAYLYQLLKEYNFTEWNDVVALLDAQSGKQVLSRSHRLIKDRDFLLLQLLGPIEGAKTFAWSKNQEELQAEGFILRRSEANNGMPTESNKKVIYLDESTLRFPLRLRKWQEGDTFYPFGMQGKKKLSKYFKDEKYSLLDKENAWVLCSGQEIVWLVGKRMDDRFKVTENTKKIIQIEYL